MTWDGQERRDIEKLIEEAAEKGAERAIEKLQESVYKGIGKGIVTKLLYLIGVITVGVTFWLMSKGIIK